MTVEGVRVQDLHGLDLLAGATILGGADGMGALVREVELVEPETALTARLTPGAAVVLAMGGPGVTHHDHVLDLLLRRAAGLGAAAIVVLGLRNEVPAATRRLADRFSLPTLSIPADRSPLELAVALRIVVTAPEVEQSRVLQVLGRRLRTMPLALDQLLDALGSALRASVSACTAQGVVAGTAPATPLTEITAVQALTSFTSGPRSAAVMPVFGMAGVPALWVTAERDDVGVLWRRTAEQALSITHGGAFAWLAREQLTAERSARLRSTLLTEILEHGDAIPAGVSEQAGMVGWQLSGWHVGVHLRFPTGSSVSASAFAMEALARNLSTDDLTLAALVERADGWSTWLTSIEPLPADYAHQIAARLRTGLTALATRARSTVAVGVGGPQRDVTGIATTLAEARQAAVIAESSGEPVAVRVVQDLDASRLLLGWYSSTLFHDHAVQILRPITASNDPELLTTLEAYLDHSCSTVHAARALGIHRNTVGQRISRAERLLGSSVQHPDTRLALQLALRIVRARTR